MFKADIVNRMEACGAMAIVRTESIERGKEIARGCLQGGVDVMEISYTLPNAGDVIAALNHEFGKTMLVGAGTILDAETCRMAFWQERNSSLLRISAGRSRVCAIAIRYHTHQAVRPLQRCWRR